MRNVLLGFLFLGSGSFNQANDRCGSPTILMPLSPGLTFREASPALHFSCLGAKSSSTVGGAGKLLPEFKHLSHQSRYQDLCW